MSLWFSRVLTYLQPRYLYTAPRFFFWETLNIQCQSINSVILAFSYQSTIMHSTLFCQIFTFSKDIKFSIGTSFFNGRGHLTVLSIWVQFLHSSNRLCDSVTLSILSDIVNPKTACNGGENVKNCCINFRFLKLLNFLLSLSLFQILCFFAYVRHVTGQMVFHLGCLLWTGRNIHTVF